MIKNLENLLIISFSLMGIYVLCTNNYELNIQSLLILLVSYSLMVGILLFFYYNFKNSISIPLFALSNFYFFITYLSLFLFDKKLIFPRFNNLDYYNAILIFFYGYLLYLFGYFIIIKILKNYRRKGFEFLNIKNLEIFILGVIFLSLNIFFYYIYEIQYIYPFLSQLKYPTSALGIGLLTLYLSTNSKNIFYFKNIISIALIIYPLTMEILVGAYNFPFLNIFLILLFISFIKKRLSYIPILLLCVLFLFFSLGKPAYRNLVWDNSANKSDQPKVISFFNVYKDIITGGKNNFKKMYICNITSITSDQDEICKNETDYRVERRVFHSFESLLIVTKFTKEKGKVKNNTYEVEFWNGYSYKILSSKIIPRIFWKNKPSDTLGNEFGHRYNVLTKADSSMNLKKDLGTSWNMPVLNEFYVNFGKIGVVFGMFFLGSLFGLITKFFSFQNVKNIEAVFTFFLILPLFFLESHLSLMFGAIFQSYIFLLVVSYISLFLLRKILLVLK